MRRGGPGKLSPLALIAATYCMVAGGPFGLEDVIGKAGGYAAAVAILLVTPLVWSLPTALMVSELSSALPQEGGFYAWVRRAMGPFWGYQEAWLSLAGSAFDMAIYPTLFAWYLGRLFPPLAEGWRPLALGAGMIAVCVAWNLAGARAVGRGSIGLTALILSPFLAVIALAVYRSPAAAGAPLAPAAGGFDLLGGVMVAMWNYMGWDNASTVAGEVERPRRTYPRTMFWGVLLVTFTYVVPVLAVAHHGYPAASWGTGGWVDIGRALGGPGLALALTLAGAVAVVGTFNALVLSLSRLPLVMAADGLLPAAFAWRHPRTGVPVVSLVACAVTWTACLGLGFDRIVTLDVLLSGLSMLLEFVALVVLRVREPGLPRPFSVPGGLAGAVAVGVGPAVLIGLSVVQSGGETIGPVSSLAVGAALVALGPFAYLLSRGLPR